MRRQWLSVLLLSCLSLAAQADRHCELIISRDNLVVAEVNGQQVYTLPKAAVDAELSRACISYTDILRGNDQLLAQTQALLDTQQDLNQKMSEQLDAYRALVADSGNLNKNYSDLSKGYNEQLGRYVILTGELRGVAHDFDGLAGEYRSIAQSLLRERRIGAAVGDDVYMLQGGYRYMNLFYLNQDGDDKVLIGAEMNF